MVDGRKAIDELEIAFDRKQAPRGTGVPVGVFGNGVPEALLAAAGCSSVDVKSPPADRVTARCAAVAPFIESFLDRYARVFLHRLGAGDFAGLAAIVFPRDDTAALSAYLYALEFMRQGILERAGLPRLVLFNLVHGTSAPIAAFNRKQTEALTHTLAEAGGVVPGPEGLERAIAAEAGRHRALGRLLECVLADSPTVTGARAMRWRNAGRWLDARRHAALLEAACAYSNTEPSRLPARRIGLVGTALDDPAVHEAIEKNGTIVCDLQPFGEAWPGPAPAPGETGGDAITMAEAGDALNPRARSTSAMLDAMVARLAARGCELVVAQYDQSDDSFGWDLPRLKTRLAAHRIALIDLGFRDLRPDAAWLSSAQDRIGDRAEVADG